MKYTQQEHEAAVRRAHAAGASWAEALDIAIAEENSCPKCNGVGSVVTPLPQPTYAEGTTTRITCPECKGAGEQDDLRDNPR